MGRHRSHSEVIPAHIDQAKLPAGVYWQPTGRGRWYTLDRDPETGRPHRRRLAGPEARLSDLHALMENEATKGTVAAVLEAFHKSLRFKKLGPRTKKDYGYYKEAIKAYPRRTGGKFGDLFVDRLTPVVIRRWIEVIEADTPSKAAHWLRYLKRALRWGVEHGECRTNPARAVSGVEEDPDHRMPALPIFRAVQAFAREHGARIARSEGSVAPYLWAVMEVAYACRLRGIEVLDLTDESISDEGLFAERRKGSNDTIVAWSPSLREAITYLQERRKKIWDRHSWAVPITPADRPIFVSERGTALTRSGFDTTYQRMMRKAVKAKVITKEQRFGLHGLKHRGVTDTAGTHDVKKQASGHKSDAMAWLYDHEVPVVQPPGKAAKEQ